MDNVFFFSPQLPILKLEQCFHCFQELLSNPLQTGLASSLRQPGQQEEAPSPHMCCVGARGQLYIGSLGAVNTMLLVTKVLSPFKGDIEIGHGRKTLPWLLEVLYVSSE